MNLPAQHAKMMGQVKTCPIHVFLHFDSDHLKKISLKNTDSFGLTFLGNRREEKRIQQWFDAYFQGIILPFPLALEAQLGPFSNRVLEQLEKIPFGKTASYRDIASALDCPKGARAVGNACHNNPFPLVVPCHRVVKSNGSLGGFAYGLEMKRRLLDFESELLGGSLFFS